MLNLIFFVIGLIAAVFINTLADSLPSSHAPLRPQWHTWGWSRRKRPLLVFIFTPLVLGSLPFFLTSVVDTAVNSFHIAVLILIIVTDPPAPAWSSASTKPHPAADGVPPIRLSYLKRHATCKARR